MSTWRHLPPLSRALLLAALAAALLYAGAHAAGFRESVTVLSGTVPVGASYSWSALAGMLYLTSYFLAVLVVIALVAKFDMTSIEPDRKPTPAPDPPEGAADD